MSFRLTPGAALVVIRSIDPAWGAKRDLIAYFGTHPDGLRQSYRQIADELGVARSWIRDCLVELEEARVLDVDPASGRRAKTYRLNPCLDRWRHVPWRVEVGAVSERVADQLTREVHEAFGSAEAVVHRSRTGALRPVVHRFVHRSADSCAPVQTGALGGLVHLSDNQPVVPKTPVVHRSKTGAQTGALRPDPPSSSSTYEGGALSGDDATSTTEEKQEEGSRKFFDAVAGLVIKHAEPDRFGRRFLAPDKRQLIRDLLAEYGTDWVKDLPDMIRVAPRAQVPGMLDWLGRTLGTYEVFGIAPGAEPDGDAPDGDALDGVAHLDDLLNPHPGLYVAEGPIEIDDEAKEAGREWISAARGALDRSQSVGETGQNGERFPAAGGVGQ